MTGRSFDIWRFVGKTVFSIAIIAGIGGALNAEEVGLALFLTCVGFIWIWEQL